MTALCSGAGPSAARPGFAQFYFAAPGTIGAAFNNSPTALAMVIAAALGVVTYDLSTFCLTDPPAMPSFTLADWVAIAEPQNYATNLASINKFRDALGNLLWPSLCECVTGTTPAVPANPTPPAGLGSLTGAQQPVIPCGTFDVAFAPNPTTPTTRLSVTPIPAGALRYTLTTKTALSGSSPSSGGSAHQVTILRADGHDLQDGAANTSAAPPQTSTFSYTIPVGTGAVNFNIIGEPSGSGDTDVSAYHVDFFCNSNTQAVPCCPPDPLASAYLQQILALVTLIQRQAAPFGYIAGTVHSALTGAGFINVADLLGVEVAITTDNATLGAEGTAPAELFGRGWVTFATADGAMQSTRLEHVHQLITPPNAGVYTLVYFDLNPLITVSITELVREP
jgi:hypothetical protein